MSVDPTTTAASAAAALATGHALALPIPGVLTCAIIGAAAAAVIEDPPQAITLAWLRMAAARAVVFMAVGFLAPYILPSLLPGRGAVAPEWALTLFAASSAPMMLRALSALMTLIGAAASGTSAAASKGKPGDTP